jgi:hypothetical protein
MTFQDWVILGLVVLVIIAILSPPSAKPPTTPFDHFGYQ